ncbi:alpha/beta fold hydrolase [Priestia aryabhattai]|uniref:alpha/beta fold hydrolase n=1 Tax=Priestia aryabhattai TaxID=412384 RepID=UPI00070BF208|nr:alpha/beta hydrolase [Priestia aryabhattai]KRE06064.1 hydrolase [Bacillus sp. Root239]MBE5098528.1 alpha/beta hydrolase [Priestia aryabhattai]
MVTYHTLEVKGLEIFYRKAGNPDKPTILLLHGFPSASHMFRDLIPVLEKDYYVIAPDYPGFGNTTSPDRKEFDYTFDHITEVIEAFVNKLELDKYALYVFDYGAPIGFRLAMRNPERVTAIISQNGNIYREGLGAKWAAREEYWENPTLEKRQSYRTAFASETIKHQYIDGTRENTVSPDGYTLDIAYMKRPGNDEKQLDLIFDYQTNVKMYPEFQQYLCKYQPPLLAVWGKNDVSFIPEGAEAFKKDLPDAEIHLVDSGHFALETHANEIGELMVDFLKRNYI